MGFSIACCRFFVIFISIFGESMGTCSHRLINGSQYRLSQGNLFRICERNPINSENVMGIGFTFVDNLSTGMTTAHSSIQDDASNMHEILISTNKFEISTPLDEICKEIEKGFKKAQKLNCSKIQFREPNFQTQKAVGTIFKQIIRMLFYFGQKQMFVGQEKIYLNWSSVDKKSSISEMLRQLTI